MSSTGTSPLCEYCSAIEFELLRHPTAHDIQILNSGSPPPDSSPFLGWEGRLDTKEWSLGLESRISKSASSCALCEAIDGIVLRQAKAFEQGSLGNGRPDLVCIATIHPSGFYFPRDSDGRSFNLHRMSLIWVLPENPAWLGPGPPKDRPEESGWANSGTPAVVVRLMDCFQTCAKGSSRGATRAHFRDVEQPVEDIMFGGRTRPPLIDPQLPASWLKNCLKNHGLNCHPGIKYPLWGRLKKYATLYVPPSFLGII